MSRGYLASLLLAAVAMTGEASAGEGRKVNEIKSIRPTKDGAVEIMLVSPAGFPPRGEIAVLCVGGKEFMMSRYPESGDTHTIIFMLTKDEFAQLRDGNPVAVHYGREQHHDKMEFGRLNKKMKGK